jgi:hypothetical protein
MIPYQISAVNNSRIIYNYLYLFRINQNPAASGNEALNGRNRKMGNQDIRGSFIETVKIPASTANRYGRFWPDAIHH